MRVSLLTVFADDTAVVELILTQESLRIVVAVDVDLSEGIVGSWLGAAVVYAGLEPRQQQFQTVPLLHLLDELIRRELS